MEGGAAGRGGASECAFRTAMVCICGEEGRRGGRVNNIAGVDEIFGQRAKYTKYFFGGFVLGECGSLFFLPASVIVGYNIVPYRI
jgi:hypothetical protein